MYLNKPKNFSRPIILKFWKKLFHVLSNTMNQRIYAIKYLNMKNILLNQFLSPVEIHILNENGQAVFNEKLGSVLRVEKRFDLSTLESGTYTMVVNAHDRNYYHTIRQ